MVKAELTYNPYLMEINVKFNGQPPRINSLIEKYQDSPLQDWINNIPYIFYDEMNGYDFELDFSGTSLDYEEVKKAFKKARVSENQVTIFLKNELESREAKTERITSLLEWLKNNPNRKFDYDVFYQKNRGLFEDDYSYVILHGNFEHEEYEGISIETVDSVDELDSTNLTHTPILFYISREALVTLPDDIKRIISRNDVDSRQVFFLINKDLPQNKIKRTIIDLGIKEPIIVSDLLDEKINKYLLLYPVSDYIHNAINAFREEADCIFSILDVENTKSENEGREIHLRLDNIEDKLKRLKMADELIMQRDNLEMPSEFADIKEKFTGAISEWKNKKTKITKDDEAHSVAAEFNSDIHRFYGDFSAQIDEMFYAYISDIKEKYIEWCGNALDDEIEMQDITFSNDDYPIIPEQTYDLLDLKEEKYVIPETNFIGRLFKSADTNTEKVPVLETTYYYQTWREHMIKTALPVAEKNIDIRFDMLKKYYDDLATKYHDLIVKHIAEKTDEKNDVSSKLSDEEKVLQKDNDWFSEFTDQIKSIERS
ncbi:hypothetical protein [Ruminococcus sp.]|uniref:hypothetical protein n=1 Tax=Ruminococcus sp. TaxID=41978 RepID=UPI0025DB1406|nr:hypothetical protein [Ruminococcus sp.]